MRLHARRGSRASGCPTLTNEHNETVAMIFSAEGQATAQARAQTLAASANLLATYGESLVTLLGHVAGDAEQPQWARLAAASIGLEVLGALRAGAEERGVEIESAGDRRVVGR